MYRRPDKNQIKIEVPFNAELHPENRWVKLAEMMPWEKIDDFYSQNFKAKDGQIAKSSRLAFGALYIQNKLNLTDEETTNQIMENPYLQYFCGFECFVCKPPFDSSMMTHFRKRISAEMMKSIAEEAFAQEAKSELDKSKDDDDDNDNTGDGSPDANPQGTLILDATCCPADIHFPTDIWLLNHARELTEAMIDILYPQVKEAYEEKPRTYRNTARSNYMTYTKKRRHSSEEIESSIGSQLQYVSRNLHTIEELVLRGGKLSSLKNGMYRKLLVINELYRQQKQMYTEKVHRCDERIVSISQPHLRPIVRGKEHNPTEFGAKVAIGLVGGYAFLTAIDWNNVPEASYLPQAAEEYRMLFGFYPKVILGDRAYDIQANKNWCKEHGIRLSGPRRGRKSDKDKEIEKKQQYIDCCQRNAVEGNFGNGKRKYGLDLIMTKLAETTRTAISFGFFVVNMERRLRLLFVLFFRNMTNATPFAFFSECKQALCAPINL